MAIHRGSIATLNPEPYNGPGSNGSYHHFLFYFLSGQQSKCSENVYGIYIEPVVLLLSQNSWVFISLQFKIHPYSYCWTKCYDQTSISVLKLNGVGCVVICSLGLGQSIKFLRWPFMVWQHHALLRSWTWHFAQFLLLVEFLVLKETTPFGSGIIFLSMLLWCSQLTLMTH